MTFRRAAFFTVAGLAVPALASLFLALSFGAAQTMPVNGRVLVESRPDLIRSAHDDLFTSGTLGRYSKMLNSVLERRLNR